VQQFTKNLRRWRAGETLLQFVDRAAYQGGFVSPEPSSRIYRPSGVSRWCLINRRRRGRALRAVRSTLNGDKSLIQVQIIRERLSIISGPSMPTRCLTSAIPDQFSVQFNRWCYAACLRLNASPARPRPSRTRVAGAGAGTAAMRISSHATLTVRSDWPMKLTLSSSQVISEM